MRNYRKELETMYNFLEDVKETRKDLLQIKEEKEKQEKDLLETWKASENKKETFKQYLEDEKKINKQYIVNDLKYNGLLLDSIKECIIQLAYNITVENMYNNIDKLDGQLIRYKKVQKILLDGLNDDFYISTDTSGLYYDLHWKQEYSKKETIYYTENHYNNGKFESYIDKETINKRQYSFYRENIPTVNDLKEKIASLEKDIEKAIAIQNKAKQEIDNIKNKYTHCNLYYEFENNKIKL
jgi:hypothetical protein